MLLYFLCIRHMHQSKRTALLPTLVRQTPKGSFPDSLSRSKLMPDTKISVYTIITHSPFIFISDFHVCNFTSSSSMDSVLINSCPLGWPYILIVFCLFVFFVYFPFWFKDRDLAFKCYSSCSLLLYYSFTMIKRSEFRTEP